MLGKYGGFVWQQQPTEEDFKKRNLGLAAMASLGVLGAYGLTRDIGSGRPIDTVYSGARFLGNVSPASFGNTFRLPEWISPFISSTAQGLKDNSYVWDKEFLQSTETFEYLKALTNKSDAELAAAGVKPRGINKLIWEKTGAFGGSLFHETADGQRHLLNDAVWLMQSTPDEPGLLDRVQKGVNKAAAGVAQAMGVTEREGFRIPALFGNAKHEAGKFMPVPALRIPGAVGEVWNASAYLRGISAFGMQRLNTLLGDVGGQIPFGGSLLESMEKLVGTGLKVRSGPASSMYARFGGKAALIGAGIMGIQTTDWIRREFGAPGQIASSALISGGLAYSMTRLGKSPKLAAAVGMATFFGQLALPGFDQGIVQGVATVGTKASILRAVSMNPFNTYRRTLEGYLPGVTDWKTGLLLGIGAAAVTQLNLPFRNKTLPQHLMETYGPKAFGILDKVKMPHGTVPVKVPRSVRQLFWDKVQTKALDAMGHQRYDDIMGGYLPSFAKKARLLWNLRNHDKFIDGDPLGLTGRLNKIWQLAEDISQETYKQNPVNAALYQRIREINKNTDSRTWRGFATRHLEHTKEILRHSFFGADLSEFTFAKKLESVGVGKRLGTVGTIVGGAFLLHGLLTGGLFGSMETANELEAQYSGKELVAVRKGRFWEGGGTPYEGGEISYYRPSLYHLMMTRTRERGLWGAGEDAMPSPVKWFLKNFTYSWERQNYYDRPYPISGAAFQDVPFIGNILAATVGKLVKPAKLMHVDEWTRGGEGGFETADVYQGFRREPNYELGGVGKGIPESRLSPMRVLGATIGQFREAEGITGWAKSMAMKAFTGEEDLFQGRGVLASSNMASSPTRMFQEMQMGGGAFMNEAIRRFLPKQENGAGLINPISNNMPIWLPEKYRYGDPYTSIEWGEARLPGAGYAALHPELQGIDPEDYPLVYRYAILADVASSSKEFRNVRSGIFKARAEGRTTEQDNALIDRTDRMLMAKMSEINFDHVKENAIESIGSGVTQGLWASGQRFLRGAAAPAEYLIPMGFRPIQKLLSDRDPIEEYEFERLYGTRVAFWDKPWRDWLRPSMYSALHFMGYDGKPVWRKEADSTNEYFDQLEFIKWMRIANEAPDGRSRIQALWQAGNTRTGINPNGTPLSIYWSLPAEERPFFNAFSMAQGSERERILEMIPEDQHHLYKAIWSRVDAGGDLYNDDTNPPNVQYLQARYQQLQLQGDMPPDDWVGWHGDTNIDDVEVRYLQSQGKEIHDFGMWESQLAQAERQPYLEGSEQQVNPNTALIARTFRQQMRTAYQSPYIEVGNGFGPSKMVYNDSREPEIMTALRERFGY